MKKKCSPVPLPKNSLTKIAEIDYESYGKELLIKGMSIKGLSCEAILHKDFKTYKVNEEMIGIGQILTTDFSTLRSERK